MSTRSAEPHYSKIAEWVSECGAVGMEVAAYQHLAKRINHSSGDRTVDPSRARLAADLGLKKPDDVDPYLRGLAALGAIRIHVSKGKRTRYELPLWPPDGYDGPENTVHADRWQRSDPEGYAAWRKAQRAKVETAEAPYAQKRRARVAKSVARKKVPAGPDVPVATGRSAQGDVPVATGTHLPVATGTHRPVATGTNQNETNEQTNRGDGRRPTTGSGGVRGSGDAASGKTKPSPTKHREQARVADIRTVLAALPEPLTNRLEGDFPRGLPAEVTTAVADALTGEMRTPGQIVDRVAARWLRFGYENDALAAEGKGLERPLGVLLELVSPSKCGGNDARCEDGVNLDTGVDCPRCEDARRDRAEAAAALAAEGGPPEANAPVPSSAGSGWPAVMQVPAQEPRQAHPGAEDTSAAAPRVKAESILPSEEARRAARAGALGGRGAVSRATW